MNDWMNRSTRLSSTSRQYFGAYVSSSVTI
jgi:hypothetical protein